MGRINLHIIDWVAWVIPLVLVGFQFQFIHLGHFWDEAWVYAPAIRNMAVTIPTILPNAISVDLSRGHPLLFQFLGGIWMKVFGMSNTSAHVFALSITISTLFIAYVFVRESFGRLGAITAVALIAAQPIFIAQSAMLYPEMLMTFGLILALKGYVEDRQWTFGIGLSIAIYSKESAIVFYLAFVLWDLLLIILKCSKMGALKKYVFPFLILLSHPVLQYLYHGWFLYPNHTDLISLDFKSIKYNSRLVFRYIFENQNRGWVFYPVIVFAAFILRLKKWWISPVLVGLGFAAYKVFVWKWVVPSWMFPILMLILLLAPLIVWLIFRSKKHGVSKLNHVIGVGYLTLTGFTLFSAMNFFTPRYLLVTVVLLCILGSLIVWRNRFLPKWAMIVVSLSMIGTSFYSTISERSAGELNLGLYDELVVTNELVGWMSQNLQRDATICSNFVTNIYLGNFHSGHVTMDTYFYSNLGNICVDCRDAKYVVITSTVECPYDINLQKDFRLLYSKESNSAYASIYERILTQ